MKQQNKKNIIEEINRKVENDRKQNNIAWKPKYFEKNEQGTDWLVKKDFLNEINEEKEKKNG